MQKVCLDCGCLFSTESEKKVRCGNIKIKNGCVYKHHKQNMKRWKKDNRDYYQKCQKQYRVKNKKKLKKYDIEYRRKNSAKIKEQSLKYYKDNKEIIAQKRKQRSQEISKYYRGWYKKNGRKRAEDYRIGISIWKNNNKEKVEAHKLVKQALKHGELKKPNLCSICMEKRYLVAHHANYSKPLEVIWLCQSCHKKIHSKT